MELHNLKPAPNATTPRKRIGRGPGSGMGGTSTRGHKGAQSRSGYKRKRGFEGGQMPLQRRLPRFGFNNSNKVIYKPINLDVLAELAAQRSLDTVDPAVLQTCGLISKNTKVKILGSGDLKKKLAVTAHAFSKTAKQAIEKLGGTTATIL